MNDDMKKIQEEMIEAFREKFVNHGEFIYKRGSYPATCGNIEAFLLKWSEKLLAEERAEWVKKIEGAKFPYEHYWYEAKQDQRLCETCFEVVERYTPCKASKHYPCWQVMNDLLQLIQKGGEL